MNIINNFTQRQVYDNALNLISAAGINQQEAVLSQSYLRSEVAVVAGKSQYHIPVLVTDPDGGNAGIPFNTERRLALQDAFVLNQLGIFIAKPSGATDTAYPLHTYPNAQEFATAGAADAFLTLYNGYLRCEVNGKVLIPYWDVMRHYLVPQTQNGVIITAQTIAPVDQNDMSTDGSYPVEPNIVIVGSKNVNINLILPTAIGTIEPNSRIIVFMRGILSQNSTSVY